jgi:hypothetical protein
VLRHLPARKCFRQGVGGHIIGRAVLQFDVSTLDHVANKVVADINVLGPRVVVVVLCEFDRCVTGLG